MEAIWKVVPGVVNFQIGVAVYFHDTLHGSSSVRGMNTASLESNMLHQLTVMREEVLFEVFFYLRKTYNSLDRGQCMDIPVGYGVGQRMERLLHLY